jgi:tetratricopeptide (TPR) repeat protein
VAWFPFQLGKVALFALVLLVATALFAGGRGAHDVMRAHGFKLALLVGLLPFAYLLSSLMAGSSSLSLIGSGVEIDTVLFTAIASVAFILSFIFFRTLRTARLLSMVVMWALAAAVLIQWLVLFFGTSLIPLDIFSDRSVNVLGKWNDFGIAVAVLAMFMLVRAELSSLSTLKKGLTALGLAVLAVLLGIVNFAFAWWLVLASALVLGLTAFFTQRGEERAERQTNPYASSSFAAKIPWFSAGAGAVAIAFILFGAQINAALTSYFPVASLEVRPSYSSTLDVIAAARGGSLSHTLFGTGPNTFSDSWIQHKPAEVNQSAFWNLDFNVGFSSALTALGTVGVIGAALWLLPIVLVIIGLIRAIRLSVLNREERIIALVVGLGSIAFLSSLVFYVPSQSIVILGFVLGGAAFGFLWRQGRSSQNDEEISSTDALLSWGVVAVLIVVALLSAWGADRRFLAQAQTNMGSVALQNGNADEALSAAARSQSIEKTGDSLRLAVSASLLELQQIANSSTASSEQAQAQFKSAAEEGIGNAQMLVAKYPNDYRSYLALGSIYDLLANLKVQGAYDNAMQSYKAALDKNPSSPDIALRLARLAAVQGDQKLTEQYLSQSLTLKPNYTDAILLVVQLNVANNDLPNAIRAAEAAAQTAPGVGPIWFELGLLYYSANDTKDAIPALEQSIAIVPDYANAKYFLGLSYYAQGRAADAIKQFEDLAKSNSDSQEVSLILSNMRSGKQPFDSAQPPVTDKPQDRPTAPITE